MEMNDTIELLKECDAGTNMAVVSIDEILEKTKDAKLKKFWSKVKRSTAHWEMRFIHYLFSMEATTKNHPL